MRTGIVDRKDDGVGRGIDIEADEVSCFLEKRKQGSAGLPGVMAIRATRMTV
jgi:hypothetical protein